MPEIPCPHHKRALLCYVKAVFPSLETANERTIHSKHEGLSNVHGLSTTAEVKKKKKGLPGWHISSTF